MEYGEWREQCDRRATLTRISTGERERKQWRCSSAHLLRSVAGLNNQRLILVIDLVTARAQGLLSLRTCSLRTRVPIWSRSPGTTSLNKRLRVITRGADDTCTITMLGLRRHWLGGLASSCASSRLVCHLVWLFCARKSLLFTVRQVVSACPVENIELEYQLGFQLDIYLESQQEFQLYLLFWTTSKWVTNWNPSRNSSCTSFFGQRPSGLLTGYPAGIPGRSGISVGIQLEFLQLKFCIAAPSNDRYHELINYRRQYGRSWHYMCS